MLSERRKIPTTRSSAPFLAQKSTNEDGRTNKYKNNSTRTGRTMPESFASASTSSRNKRRSSGFLPPTTLDVEPEDDTSTTVRSETETEESVVIAPTRHQRQLMRQVSGLGLEDPVFGGRETSIKEEHFSFIFEDMGCNDVPEGMRDMISLASDRTDEVEIVDKDGQYIEESKFSKLTDKTPSGYSHSQTSSSHRRCSVSSFPPLGLDPAATASSLCSKKIPRDLTLNNSSQTSSVISGLSPVPPSGSHQRKPRQRRSSCASTSIVLSDKYLAAQVNAMLSMGESSRGSLSSTSHVRNTHRKKKESQRMSKGRDDSRSSTSSKYAPPSLPLPSSTKVKDRERYLPESMDEIFSSKRSFTSRRQPESMDEIFSK